MPASNIAVEYVFPLGSVAGAACHFKTKKLNKNGLVKMRNKPTLSTRSNFLLLAFLVNRLHTKNKMIQKAGLNRKSSSLESMKNICEYNNYGQAPVLLCSFVVSLTSGNVQSRAPIRLYKSATQAKINSSTNAGATAFIF
jgi:hypothetical protein